MAKKRLDNPTINPSPVRHLVLVLGDQLDPESAAFDDFDPGQDTVWMAEVREESTHVWTHKARIAIFLAAMRHFRENLKARGIRVQYRELGNGNDVPSLAAALEDAIGELQPGKLIVVEPGEYRVRDSLAAVAAKCRVPIDIRPDRHFLASHEEFHHFAAGRKQLRLEFFYRDLRRRDGILMDGDKPVGGDWNYDADNRGSFPKSGPGKIPTPIAFHPDAITREVLDLVERTFPEHPGSLAHFDWAVTRADAARVLDDFITHRLAEFGQFQDAMWEDEPYLYHSRLSSAMNLKLLNPRDVLAAAEQSYRAGKTPLPAAEGFIRQILGWREYVRGIYWEFMPGYLDRNALNAQHPLPGFYWTGDTEMNCLKQAIGQTLRLGYAHHIQRLMVTGLFALLFGVHPRRVHEWYLAVYVDAVEWVELPNTLGMSQFGDGGVMASKPYCASGKYIDRMSNYCKGCRFDPDLAVGADACPFTTLYWDFLMRHRALLTANNRTVMQIKNLDRKPSAEQKTIQQQAEKLRISLL